MIGSLSSSKLTGALPAVDGSALLNVPSFIKNASDPATDSNPSSGLGTVWVNTTSGEMFSLTDATTDENVWTNIGSGSGDVEPATAFGGNGGGRISGFNSGGYAPSGPSTQNVIEKFSLTTDADATDVGDLPNAREQSAGQSSLTHGYNSGGHVSHNDILKFAFATNGNATDIANLTQGRGHNAGCSSSSHGYTIGGSTTGGPSAETTIDKFTFSADADATDVGDMTVGVIHGSSSSSLTHGYMAGGHTGNYTARVPSPIMKVTFSADANATSVGDLTIPVSSVNGGQSSNTHGYSSGGDSTGPGMTDSIQKYSFSTDGNSTDVANITAARCQTAGQSSITHGYVSGGTSPLSNVIEKFTFASDADATDVGDLTVTSRYGMAGHQY